jgi:YfiH family protein
MRAAMGFIETGGIRYFVFDSFQHYGVLHGFITRAGGVSAAPWESLNLGGTTGDDPTHVLNNHLLLFNAFERDFASMYDTWQVHGNEVLCTRKPRLRNQEHHQADGILTDEPMVTLLMRFADCVPILLYDPVNNAGGIVHAGWQGTVKKIPAAAVTTMIENYGSRPENIMAGIGPSIGPAEYEVGEDFFEKVKEPFHNDIDRVLISYNNRIHFDLWTANQITLWESGVTQIDVAKISTYTNTQDWFSHRREHGKTGRFGAIFALPEK